MKLDANSYEYFAFISYKREDEKWAKWLQKKLEYYKLPSSVRNNNPNLPEKIRPVFKDTTDLEPGVLSKKIQDALDSSKFLIVICSPRSANSIWVSKEVQLFLSSGRADNIIPFIIGGIPNAINSDDECFPKGLRQLAGERELLGANINEMGREAAAIKVIARMCNLRFDTLWQRYQREETKRKWIIRSAAMILLFFLTTITIIINNKNIKLKDLNSQLKVQKKALATANDSILREKERFRAVNILQSLAIAESKIHGGDFGYALSQLVLIKDNENVILENKAEIRYNEVVRLLSDSLSNSNVKLLNIVDTKKDSVRADTYLKLSSINSPDTSWDDIPPTYFSYYSNGKKNIDSVYVCSRVWNRERSIMAVCDGTGEHESDGLTTYSPGQNGIFIIENKTGKLLGFVGGGGWFPSLFYPIAIDSLGNRLIYRTGHREAFYVRIHDFSNNRTQFIEKSENNHAYLQNNKDIEGSFNNDGSKYVLVYTDKFNNEPQVLIKINSTNQNKELIKFSIPDCKGAFWDNNDYLNIICPNYTFVFKVNEKERIYSEILFNEPVNNVAISSNNDIAVLTSNGKIYLLGEMGKKSKSNYTLLGSGDNLEFCPLDNSLWITDGYDALYVLNTKVKKIINLPYKGGSPSHHWMHDIGFTDRGYTCVTYNHYPGSGYRKFDCTKRKLIEKATRSYKELGGIFNKLRLQVDSLDMLQENPLMSSVKISGDRRYILRSYYSGKVIISNYDSYAYLLNRLGILNHKIE